MINKNVSWEDCKAGRQEQSKLLTKMLENRYQILKQRAEHDKSLINTFSLNLDAGWGFGKTHFIERWAKDLSDKHVVLMFNAWEHDYQKDAMTCLLSALLSQISEYFSEISSTNDKIKKKLKKVGSAMANFAKIAAPAAINVVSTATLGVKLGALITSDPEYSDTDEAVEKLTGLLGGKMAEQLFSNKEKYGKSLTVFKESMRGLIDAIENETGFELPIYVFIDDLDRCRPDFTLEIIECVKHILEIDSLYFVFATDTEQLEKSIKAIYGEELDSEKYLKRVFNRECKLKEPVYDKFSEFLFQENIVFEFDKDLIMFPGGDKVECNKLLSFWFSLISRVYKLDLRTQLACRDQIQDVLSIRVQEKTMGVVLIHLVVLWNINKDFAENLIYRGGSKNEDLKEPAVQHVEIETIRWVDDYKTTKHMVSVSEIIENHYRCVGHIHSELHKTSSTASLAVVRQIFQKATTMVSNTSDAYGNFEKVSFKELFEQIKMIA